VPRLILAAVNPDNTPHGYNLTFAFPMLLFIIIGGILYLLFSRPPRRIPARSVTLPARSAGGAHAVASTASAATAAADTAEPDTAEPHTGEPDTGEPDTGDDGAGPATESAGGEETEKDAE
jgi:hypothetical protein